MCSRGFVSLMGNGAAVPLSYMRNLIKCSVGQFSIHIYLYFAYIHRAARVGAISLMPEDNRVGASSYLSGNAPSPRLL